MKTIDLVNSYLLVYAQQKVYEKQLELLKTKLLPRLKVPVVAGGFTVAKTKRAVFKDVSMQEARKYKATKIAIDTTKLAQLLKDGESVKGVRFTEYVTVNQTIG